MKYTTNYNLKKPEENEFYSVGDSNGNMDIIDAQLKELGSGKQDNTVTEEQTSDADTLGFSGTFEAIDNVTRDENGHVIKINKKRITLPAKPTDVAKLTTKRKIDGISFSGENDITHMGTCNTASGESVKTVSIENFNLVSGAYIHILFSNANVASAPTLNVNSAGAKAIKMYGTANISDALYWDAGDVVDFIYNGTYWIMCGVPASVVPKLKTEVGGILEKVYPVGSIYMSVNNTDPGTLFGGTWERWAHGQTLVGVYEDDADFNGANKVGGAKTHTLTEAQLPKIAANMTFGQGEPANGSALRSAGGKMKASNAGKCFSGTTNNTLTSYNRLDLNFGSGQAHNNMPPYITCYIWKRIA